MSRPASGDARQKILEAAQERLWRYGFKKTTIDEIAADAGVGKGTVYLHFDSKEDIALAIIAQYKAESITRMQAIAHAEGREPRQKLFEVLYSPILWAHERCISSPAAQEMIVVMRPHIRAHIQHFLEQEIDVIAEILQEGNRKGVFQVSETQQAARSLKWMCMGFMPPYPYLGDTEAIREEVGRIVDLVFCGIRHPESSSEVCWRAQDLQEGQTDHYDGEAEKYAAQV